MVPAVVCFLLPHADSPPRCASERASVRACACVCVRARCSFCFVLKGKNVVTTPFRLKFTAFLFSFSEHKLVTLLIYRSGGALAMGGDCWACLVVFGGAGCVWYVVWPHMRVCVVSCPLLPSHATTHLCCWCCQNAAHPSTRNSLPPAPTTHSTEGMRICQRCQRRRQGNVEDESQQCWH